VQYVAMFGAVRALTLRWQPHRTPRSRRHLAGEDKAPAPHGRDGTSAQVLLASTGNIWPTRNTVSPPVDQPSGVREYGARDPEGQLWYFHEPLA